MVSTLVRGYLLVVPIVLDEAEKARADTVLTQCLEGMVSVYGVICFCQIQIHLKEDLLQQGSHFLLQLGFHNGSRSAVEFDEAVQDVVELDFGSDPGVDDCLAGLPHGFNQADASLSAVGFEDNSKKGPGAFSGDFASSKHVLHQFIEAVPVIRAGDGDLGGAGHRFGILLEEPVLNVLCLGARGSRCFVVLELEDCVDNFVFGWDLVIGRGGLDQGGNGIACGGGGGQCKEFESRCLL